MCIVDNVHWGSMYTLENRLALTRRNFGLIIGSKQIQIYFAI